MSETLNLVINFVNPPAPVDPDVPEYIPATAATAQTGDWFVPVAVMLCIAAVLLIAIFARKFIMPKGSHVSKSAITKTNTYIVLAATAFMAAIICASLLWFVSLGAHADEGSIYMDSAVNAVVDEEGNVSIDDASLKSIDAGKVVEFKFMNITLTEGIEPMDDVKWRVALNNQEVYNDKVPGWIRENHYLNNQNTISFDVEGMDKDTVISLIGKSPINISFEFKAVDPPKDNKTLIVKSDVNGKIKQGVSGTPTSDPFVFTFPFDDKVQYKVDTISYAIFIYHEKDAPIELYPVVNNPEDFYHLGWFLNGVQLGSQKYDLDEDTCLEKRYDNYVLIHFYSDANGMLQPNSLPATTEPIVYKVPKKFSFTVYDYGWYTYISCGSNTVSNVNNEGFTFDKWINSAGQTLAGSSEGITYNIGDGDYYITATHKAEPVISSGEQTAA